MTAEDAYLLVFPLAVVGAAMVLAASILQGKGREARAVAVLSRLGYGCTFLSMALFIYVGFLSER